MKQTQTKRNATKNLYFLKNVEEKKFTRNLADVILKKDDDEYLNQKLDW